jgi:drug/metabolite transporter (DMT)-like permease
MNAYHRDNRSLGILFIIISSLCLSFMSMLVKKIGHLPIMEIMFFQNLPTMIIMPIILMKLRIPIFGNNKALLLINGFVSLSAQLTKFYTFTVMLLADATIIHRLSPFIVFFLSGIFLKEKLHFKRVPILLLAFFGGTLVIKPGFQNEIFPFLVALIAAVFISFSHINLRYLRLSDHHLVITNAISYISGIGSLAILLFQKSYQPPNFMELSILISIGIFAIIAWTTITKAFQLAEANVLSLYTYSQILFASIFGLIFFQEFPDYLSIIGGLLIIISGYLNYRLKVKPKKVKHI